jgi:sulfide:quinone oxidoreductase
VNTRVVVPVHRAPQVVSEPGMAVDGWVVRGTDSAASYDGRGICYLEVGDGQLGKVDVTFGPGERPTGQLEGPSVELAGEKSTFGESRVARWFGRDWRPLA